MAAITGLASASRVGPMGPGPSSATGRRSPSESAVRSAPAQKVPPAPVRTATAAAGSASKARKASSRAAAVAPSTALRRSGRHRLTTVTGPSDLTSMVPTAAFSPSADHPGDTGAPPAPAGAIKVTQGVDNSGSSRYSRAGIAEPAAGSTQDTYESRRKHGR